MSEVLVHRGPDDAGTFVSERCGFAHRRLSILDTSAAGRQPMVSGPITLITNGEIYNFRELAKTHGLNAELKSRTDTEVLLRLIAQQGPEKTLATIDGMYAWAAWDANTETLHLARDPFGVKPLFVLEHDGLLWFASEIKPLLMVPGFEARPSLEALHHYLSFDYIPGALTAFEGIEEVRPGSWWQIDSKTGRITRDHHHPTAWAQDPTITKQDAIAHSRTLLENAVERQLVADVNVGVMLSGGMDSSTIAALTKQVRASSDFHTFSIGFDDPSFDESHHAQLMASHLGTHHHHISVTADDIAALLPHYLGSIHEPYADGSAMPTALLAAKAREHVTVLLSGEGGDEMFTGYDTHAAWVARGWYRQVPGWIRQHVVGPVVRSLPVSHNKLSFDFKAKRFAHGAEFSPARSHYAWREVLNEEAKAALLKFNAAELNFSESHHLYEDTWNRCDSDEALHAMLHTDRTYHLPDDLMVKNDRMTMAHSIEARVPFCDTELVAFLATVPTEHFMTGLRPKSILKEATRDLLPPSISNRKKMGLEMPYSSWIRGPLATMVDDILSTDRLNAIGLFHPEPVQMLLQDHKAMRVDNGRGLWGIINYVLWHEMFIQSKDTLSTTAAGPFD